MKIKKIIAALTAITLLLGSGLSNYRFSNKNLGGISVYAGEQLTITDFSGSQFAPWEIVPSGGGKLSAELSGGSYNIKIESPGGKSRGGADRWDCQFRHRELKIVEGHQYQIKYTVEATNEGQLYAQIANYDGDTAVWHNNSNTPEEFEQFQSAFPVEGNKKLTFESTFTAAKSLPKAEFTFHFGGAGKYQQVDCFPAGTVLKFYDVSLVDLTSDENDFIPEVKEDKNPIRVNQLGYFTKLKKTAVLALNADDGELKTFSLHDGGGKEVFSGTSTYFGFDKDSGEYLHILDFSDYKEEGKHFYVSAGDFESRHFDIGDPFVNSSYAPDSESKNLFTDAMNYFYQNRSGVEIKSEYITSGDKVKLARGAGNANDDKSAYVQPAWVASYATDGSDVDKSITIDAAGGWYDAGDFGKYVVNAGISVWTLTNIYEFNNSSINPGAINSDDGSLIKIPENGDGIPDILNESKWEMDWLFKMMVANGEYAGMAYHKTHDHIWSGLGISPADYNASGSYLRIVKPPSTAATLNVAAAAAQMSRAISKYDKAYSELCLENAVKAYDAAKAHPDMYAPLDQGVGGGAYGDDDVSDEFYWAACELYTATGEEKYLTDMKSYKDAFKTASDLSGGENSGSFGSFNWGNVASLGNLSILLNPSSKVANEVYYETLGGLTAAADIFLEQESKQGYGLPYRGVGNGYEWGSNSFIANNAIVLSYAYKTSNDEKYLNGVVSAMDYLLGKNANDFSYVTGYGSNFMKNPHHRYWAYQLNDNFPKAPSGVLSGGPNSDLSDPKIQGSGKKSSDPPQTIYLDDAESYSTNEVTINWNAPLAWVAYYLELNAETEQVQNANDDGNIPDDKPAAKDGKKQAIGIGVIVGIAAFAAAAVICLIAVVSKKKKNG